MNLRHSLTVAVILLTILNKVCSADYTKSMDPDQLHLWRFTEKENNLFEKLGANGEDGIHKTYWDGKSIQSAVSFRDGKKDGSAIWYYKNGNVQYRINYIDGALCGNARYYHEDGTLAAEMFVNYFNCWDEVANAPPNKGRYGNFYERDKTGRFIRNRVLEDGITVSEDENIYANEKDYQPVKIIRTTRVPELNKVIKETYAYPFDKTEELIYINDKLKCKKTFKGANHLLLEEHY